MNKKKVDELIPRAVDVLKTSGIADGEDTIAKTYRGQISTFGAAVTNGSLISAVAFFSDNGGSSVERKKLLEAIKQLLGEEVSLFDYVKTLGKDKEKEAKEKILNAAIALKLAMNLYELK